MSLVDIYSSSKDIKALPSYLTKIFNDIVKYQEVSILQYPFCDEVEEFLPLTSDLLFTFKDRYKKYLTFTYGDAEYLDKKQLSESCSNISKSLNLNEDMNRKLEAAVEVFPLGIYCIDKFLSVEPKDRLFLALSLQNVIPRTGAILIGDNPYSSRKLSNHIDSINEMFMQYASENLISESAINEAQSIAILHDIEEVCIGDVPNYKRHPDFKKIKSVISNIAIDVIFEGYPQYKDIICGYEEQSSDIARVIHDIDKVDAALNDTDAADESLKDVMKIMFTKNASKRIENGEILDMLRKHDAFSSIDEEKYDDENIDAFSIRVLIKHKKNIILN